MLENNNNKSHVTTNSAVKPAVVDLCSGMGGLSLAAQQLGMHIVAGVDTSAASLKTYINNFPNAVTIEKSVLSGSISKTCKDALQLKNVTGVPLVVVSGPPCQGFSVAGPRDPSDKRNKILLAVGRIIVKLSPQCALIENVSALLDKKHADRVRTFRRNLENAGYSIITLLLDAKDYGVPQRRKRTIFLVSRAILNEKEVLRRLNELKKEEVTVREAFYGLPFAKQRPKKYYNEINPIGVPNHYAMRHSIDVRRKIAAIKPGTGPMSYRKLHPNRPANTLFSGHRAPPAHYQYSRSITVREAARLQGFPDSFRIYGSFGKQMEQVTNAVPPSLAKAALRVLAEQNSITI